uniref:Uncharacterized protein n=1 Tax=Serinus canaria TaxID=9135 RepID=A0A8C9UAM2_SERCA
MAVVGAGHTRLTSSLDRMAASEKTLGSLDVTSDFGNHKPWDPWFGDLQGREDKAVFQGDEGWNRILGCRQCGLARMSPWCLPAVQGRGTLWLCPAASDKLCQTLKSSHFFSWSKY